MDPLGNSTSLGPSRIHNPFGGRWTPTHRPPLSRSGTQTSPTPNLRPQFSGDDLNHHLVTTETVDPVLREGVHFPFSPTRRLGNHLTSPLPPHRGPPSRLPPVRGTSGKSSFSDRFAYRPNPKSTDPASRPKGDGDGAPGPGPDETPTSLVVMVNRGSANVGNGV